MREVQNTSYTELSCTWVPGTTDIVCLLIGQRRIEMTSHRLQKIFGPHAISDLFLKGKAIIQAEPRQIAALA